MARKKLTERHVERRRKRADGKSDRDWDIDMPGFVLNISATGKKSFTLHFEGKYHFLGKYPDLTATAAREQARAALVELEREKLSTGETVREVGDRWYKLEKEPTAMHRKAEVQRTLRVYVYPYLADRKFEDIKQKDINEVLDKLELRGKYRQADNVRSIIGQVVRWYKDHNEHYNPPAIRKKHKLAIKKRSRFLNDEEIFAFWECAKGFGMYGSQLQFALLTGQRIGKIVHMKWKDLKDDVWTVRVEHETEKDTIRCVQLSSDAFDILQRQEKVDKHPYVFPSSRTLEAPYDPNGKIKAEFDALMKKRLPEMKAWTVHDLRRTARTLLARARVSREVAERVLGHAMEKVEPVYNLHEYYDEKHEALNALAALIRNILVKQRAERREHAEV